MQPRSPPPAHDAAATLPDAIDWERVAHPAAGDWPTYHGQLGGNRYSGLDQINTGNVKNLKVAFITQVARSTRGLESQPLAKDGILYFSASYSKVFAVKGDTGEIIWSYTPKLDEDLVARQTHSPRPSGSRSHRASRALPRSTF